MKAEEAERTSVFLRDWRRWREDRLGAVNAPEGNAALAVTHWLDTGDELAGLPGRWREVGDEVRVALAASDQALVDGVPIHGDVVAFARGSEIGLLIRFPDRSAQVTRRRGRFGVRVYEHARADSVRAIDAFPPSLEWIIAGTFAPLPGGSTLDYEFELEDSVRAVGVPGLVTFEIAGRSYEARPFLDDGALLLVFADDTTGRTSKPPSRFLFIAPPTADARSPGAVTLDFNRAFLPPCAFSDEYNCPLPPPGHRFALPITAGETFAELARGDDRAGAESTPGRSN